tara:strand:- start:175 stop:543 length:369 start_codon:yes stop_codon:yes gene_type:complete
MEVKEEMEEDKEKIVQAICIDYYHIYTMCCNPDCKEHIHIYGSEKNVKNRMEFRASHCLYSPNEIVGIRIDDTTKRAVLKYYPNKSITISRRKYKDQLKALKIKEERDKVIIKKGKFSVKFK